MECSISIKEGSKTTFFMSDEPDFLTKERNALHN